jgi:uncharacterized protein DUF1761
MSSTRHVSIVVAAIVVWVLGAVWYSALADAWMAGIGKTRDQLMQQAGGSASMSYVVGFVAILVMAYLVGWLLDRMSATTFGAGARIGALAALLPAACIALNYAFEMRPVSLWLINAGYAIVGLAIAGAIIGGWKRKAEA